MPIKYDSSARADERNYRTALGILLLLIAYGSLYPLTWNFDKPQAFILMGPVGLADLFENIVLFLPLGWMVAWHYHGRPHYGWILGIWFVLALLLASVLQWLQIYLPRTPALLDIVFNMVGQLLGSWGGWASARSLNRLLQRHQNLDSADRFAALMVAIWLVAELFPLIPTVDVSVVVGNVKSLWQQEAWQPRRMLLHMGMTMLGLEALAHLVRTVSSGGLARGLAGVATLAVLIGKFLVIDQSPGLAVVLGIGGGTLLWWGIDHLRERLRLRLLFFVAVGSYLLYAAWPWELREPEPMLWLPFASSLSNSIESVVTSVAFECLCFGAIIWIAVRKGALLVGTTVSAAFLAFGCEYLQRYLPGRTAEITSVLLALAMGWLVAALGRSKAA